MTTNFGDFQNEVYADAVKGKNVSIPLRFPVHSAESVSGPARLGVPVRVGGGRATHTTGEHRGVFALWNRAPDDGEPWRQHCLLHQSRWTSGEFRNLLAAAATRSGKGRRLHPGDVRLRRARCHDVIIALALGATAVGIGRPYAYALSYGGAESLTHFLWSFLAGLDLCLAVCGFKDIATLKEAGCEPAMH